MSDTITSLKLTQQLNKTIGENALLGLDLPSILGAIEYVRAYWQKAAELEIAPAFRGAIFARELPICR